MINQQNIVQSCYALFVEQNVTVSPLPQSLQFLTKSYALLVSFNDCQMRNKEITQDLTD